MQDAGRNSRKTDGVAPSSATPVAKSAQPATPSSFNSGFKPPWWCRNPHLQTLWPYLFRRKPVPEYRRERVELPDGDFLDLDWTGPGTGSPIVLIIHGLCGDSMSHYVRGLAGRVASSGLRAVVLHHRGCSGEPNRLVRSYHGGDYRDIDQVLNRLREREPSTPLFAAGFSIGGSMLLNWLSRNHGLLTAAGAVSVPLDLRAGVVRLGKGFSRIYQAYLVAEMRRRVLRKSKRIPMPVDLDRLRQVKTFPEFDGLVTAPIHGFPDADDYYARCSAKLMLTDIEIPTLVIHAADDPLTSADAIPAREQLTGNGGVSLELSRHGGHCGFVTGAWPHRARYWADQRVTDFFLSFLPDTGR